MSGPSVSACSDAADFRGPGQRVISYSFYGSVDRDYFTGIRRNMEDVLDLYPGYVMRLYTDIGPGQKGHAELCQLFCQTASILDVCYVRQLGECF